MHGAVEYTQDTSIATCIAPQSVLFNLSAARALEHRLRLLDRRGIEFSQESLVAAPHHHEIERFAVAQATLLVAYDPRVVDHGSPHRALAACLSAFVHGARMRARRLARRGARANLARASRARERDHSRPRTGDQRRLRRGDGALRRVRAVAVGRSV